MKTRSILAAALLAAAPSLFAEVVTLPAASSLVGINPFFSDVRTFNTSYTDNLEILATYRCFIGTAVASCPATPPQIAFTLAPRESRAFDDMVASAGGFAAHDTAGGIEFEFSGPQNQLVVTSRLYSNAPLNSVGMFIPGLPLGKARASTVLTSLRHDGPNGILPGFRTNAGVFNPNDASAQVEITIFDQGAQAADPIVRSVAGHSGFQISGVFEASGLGDLGTENATIVVTSDVPIFSYGVVIDGRTADPIFVQGAPNEGGAAATPTPTPPGLAKTATPTPPGPSPTKTPTSPAGPSPTRTSTRTPTVPGPTHTPTPPGPTATPTMTLTPGGASTSTPTPTITVPPTITRTPTPTATPTPTNLPNQVNVGPGMVFNPITITINAGETVNWVWKQGGHSSTSDTGIWDSGVLTNGSVFPQSFPTAGTFPYHCVVHGAAGGIGMHGTVIVNP